MESTIHIREATRDDAIQITDILLDSIGHLKSESVEYIVENRVLPNLDRCFSDNSHSIYLAEEMELILGYVSVHWLPYLFFQGPEGFISELFVSKSGRARGIGRSLTKKVIQEAKERNCCRLSLLNDKNQDSYQQRFYTKNGWIEREDMANFVYRLNKIIRVKW